MKLLEEKVKWFVKIYVFLRMYNVKEVRGCTLKSSRGLCPPEAISSFESLKHQRVLMTIHVSFPSVFHLLVKVEGEDMISTTLNNTKFL